MPLLDPFMSSAFASCFSQVTILTLDDDPNMRAILRSALREAGCREVLQTGDGNDALNIVRQRQVDLIVSDCRMEPMDGLVFLRRLRELPEGRETPVIMLTASSEAEEAWQARELKASAWLVKPVKPQALIGHVAAALGLTPPRLHEDALGDLADRFERRLPAEVNALEQLAAGFAGDADHITALRELIRRLHNVKGQAGMLGYPLLGELAGRMHDLLREYERDTTACAPLQADVARLATVVVAAMKLVGDRQIRGNGGSTGAKLMAQIGAFANPLRIRITTAISDAERADRARRDAQAERRIEAEQNRWAMARRINLDPAGPGRA